MTANEPDVHGRGKTNPYLAFAALVLLSSVALGAKDCLLARDDGGCVCSPYACQQLVIDQSSALPPDNYITWDGEAFELIDTPDRSPPPAGACYAKLEGVDVGTLPEQASPGVDQSILIDCVRGAGDELVYGVHLGDTRALQVGDDAEMGQGWYGDPNDPTLYLFLDCAVTVEESAGAAALFPAMVTSDFRRVLRVEITPGPTGTGKPVVSASLQFVLTAASFHGNPNGTCQECAC